MNANEIYAELVLPQLTHLLEQAIKNADAEFHQLAQLAEDDQEQNQHYTTLQQLRIQTHSVIFHFQQYWLKHIEPGLSDTAQQVNSLSKLLNPGDYSSTSKILSNGETDPITAHFILHSFLHALTHTGLCLHSNVQVLRQFELELADHLSTIQDKAYQALAAIGITTLAEPLSDELKNKTQAISRLSLALGKLQNSYRAELASLLQRNMSAQEAPNLSLLNYQQAFNDKQLDMGPVSEAEQKTLNAIAHLFSLIINRPDLDDKAKQIILWLQIPYSCIALNDSQFLHNSQHVAHYVLDELIHLAQRWQNYEQTAQLPALQQKLIQTILSIWRHPVNDKSIMQQILYDLLLYNDGLKQQQAASSKQEEGQHIAKKAQEIIHQQIDEACYQALSSAVAPILSSELINQGWKPLMYLLASKYGLDSEPWEKSIEALEELAFSLQAADSYSSRTEYLLQLPPLLKKLTTGLKAVQTPSKTSQFLQALSLEHIAIAEQIANTDIDDEAIEQQRNNSKQLDWVLFQLDAEQPEQNEQADQPSSKDEDSHDDLATAHGDTTAFNLYAQQEEILQQLGPGSELNWLVKGKPQRLRLAAYIKHTEQFILIYPNGSKAMELNREEFLEKLRAGELESLGAGSFFNEALATVIHGMRQQ